MYVSVLCKSVSVYTGWYLLKKIITVFLTGTTVFACARGLEEREREDGEMKD